MINTRSNTKQKTNIHESALLECKQIRLEGFDYSKLGYYFVTICTQDHKCLFGNIVGNVVGLFKSEITKKIRIITNNPQFNVWQRNFYEHIVRNESELNKIREYIKTNPEIWNRDRNNPEFKIRSRLYRDRFNRIQIKNL